MQHASHQRGPEIGTAEVSYVQISSHQGNGDISLQAWARRSMWQAIVSLGTDEDAK